jgi:hypothetical protein
MGSREEDNVTLLLGAVALICLLIAFAPALLAPSQAMANKSAVATSDATASDAQRNLSPARVIVPFTPNTTPAAR